MTRPLQTIILEKSGYKIIADGPLIIKYVPERYEHTYTLFNMRVEDAKGNIITPIIEEIEVGFYFEISAAVCWFQGYAIIDGAVYFETHSRKEESYKFFKIKSGKNTKCNSDELKNHLDECKLNSIVNNQTFSNYIFDIEQAIKYKENNDRFSWEGGTLIITPN
jgi:hypothetical protein